MALSFLFLLISGFYTSIPGGDNSKFIISIIFQSDNDVHDRTGNDFFDLRFYMPYPRKFHLDKTGQNLLANLLKLLDGRAARAGLELTAMDLSTCSKVMK